MHRRPFLLGIAALPFAAREAAALEAVSPERTLVFPRDFGAHPSTQIEWWYATGWLAAASAPAVPTHGFQVTFFRSRTGVDAAQPSRFAATQLIFVHTALTDLNAQRLRHDQRIARSGMGIAGASIDDTAANLRGWKFERSGTPEASRYRTRIASEAVGFSFDFTLATTQPLLLQGTNGYSRKGPRPGQASHYYSQPQLAVTGTLGVDGRSQPVVGRAWLDHEWSDALLDPQAVGWDWIGMNLDDGGALTAFRLRRADGSVLYAGGSFRPPGGKVRNFAPDEVQFNPGRTWASAATRATYPVQWTVTTPAGTFAVHSLLDDQELDSRNSTGSVYWEGLSELKDASGQRIGRGYLEMTGYAGALRL